MNNSVSETESVVVTVRAGVKPAAGGIELANWVAGPGAPGLDKGWAGRRGSPVAFRRTTWRMTRSEHALVAGSGSRQAARRAHFPRSARRRGAASRRRSFPADVLREPACRRDSRPVRSRPRFCAPARRRARA